MAVLTPVLHDDAVELTKAYGLGPLEKVEGIAAGSVNSNFSIRAGGLQVFLRLYEEQDLAGARRETATLEHLAASGVPTPAPLRRLDGDLVSIVRGKPAAVFPWRDGSMRCQASVSPDDARLVGGALARVHRAGAGRPAIRGRFGYEELLARLDSIGASGHPELGPRAGALRDALARAHSDRDTSIPRGLTHGDLFRDNVLWDERGRISALLDFESACDGTYAYDLMVTVLSWCVGDDLDASLARAMREGYEEVRPLAAAERRALLAEGRFACLRFTITRITDYALRPPTEGPRVIKDWRRFLMRFERLTALGTEGLTRVFGV
ncbi:MAG: homoserine kinase [Polyangiaceae bacterium]|nr:homoserine kinase [Polyangiaceae bacterium]